MLLIIADKMLQCNTDALISKSIDIVAGQCSREQRVLRKRLKAPSAQRPALNVDRWSEDNMRSFGVRLVAEQVSNLDSQIRIEGSSDGSPTW